jgi:hypothetical protein
MAPVNRTPTCRPMTVDHRNERIAQRVQRHTRKLDNPFARAVRM